MESDAKEFVQAVLPFLPPVIARADVGRFLGGVVDQKTLRNADNLGQGPKIVWRVGRKVVYRSDSLVSWIVEKFGVSRITNPKTL